MILMFEDHSARENYNVSGLEATMAHNGWCLAYVQADHTFWKPLAAGRGAAKWKLFDGPFTPRALPGIDTTKADEQVAGYETVQAGEERVLLGSATVGVDQSTDAQIVLDGEMRFEFRGRPATAFGSTEEVRDELTIDGQKTIDGELTFRNSLSHESQPMTQQTIGHSQKITVPAGWQMMIAGVPVLNGEYDIDGEIA